MYTDKERDPFAGQFNIRIYPDSHGEIITICPWWDKQALRILNAHGTLWERHPGKYLSDPFTSDRNGLANYVLSTEPILCFSSAVGGFSLIQPNLDDFLQIKHTRLDSAEPSKTPFLTLKSLGNRSPGHISTLYTNLSFNSQDLLQVSRRLLEMARNPEITLKDVRQVVDFHITGVFIEVPQ